MRVPRDNGIVGIKGDFVKYRPIMFFDLVLCLQVLEHLKDPSKFAKKLLTIGGVIIISVPYKWERGICREHRQDPVDEQKILDWTSRQPIYSTIVVDDYNKSFRNWELYSKRWIGVYKSSR